MNRRIFVPSILIASLLFALVGFGGPASAQYAASCTYDAVSTPNTVSNLVGNESSAGFQPGETVTVKLTTDLLVDVPAFTPINATADGNGLWTATPVVVPAGLANGDYLFVASSVTNTVTCGFLVDVQSEVVEPTVTPTPDVLAFTGAESGALAKYGLGILAAGGLVLFAANRRKEAVTD